MAGTLDLDLADARSFLVLSQEGSYARAASRLNLTSSALTKRIQRLERMVGEILVVRDHAGLHGLTPAGQRFADGLPLLLRTAARVLAMAQNTRETSMMRSGHPSVPAFFR
jgi:DNA-binding transcriptional LysR family regulator